MEDTSDKSTGTENNGFRIFKNDKEIIHYIAGLSIERMREFDCFKPLDFKHYLETQQEWIKEESWYLGINLCHQPSDTEIVDDMDKTHLGERFKVIYVLKYPKKVEKMVDKKKE